MKLMQSLTQYNAKSHFTAVDATLRMKMGIVRGVLIDKHQGEIADREMLHNTVQVDIVKHLPIQCCVKVRLWYDLESNNNERAL